MTLSFCQLHYELYWHFISTSRDNLRPNKEEALRRGLATAADYLTSQNEESLPRKYSKHFLYTPIRELLQ